MAVADFGISAGNGCIEFDEFLVNTHRFAFNPNKTQGALVYSYL